MANALAALGLAACAPAGDAPGDALAAPFVPAVDTNQLMLSVIEPASEIYWDAVGWILDLEGTTTIEPSSPEEWQAVFDAAVVIAESANLLMIDGRAQDEGEWIAWSRTLMERGRNAMAAAQARDTDAVFEAGGEVYLACSGCHARYAVELVRPSDEAGSSSETGPSDEIGASRPDESAGQPGDDA